MIKRVKKPLLGVLFDPFCLLCSCFLPFEVQFSQIMGHSDQGELGGYLFEAPEVEAAEAHVSFDVSKATFYFYTSPFPELEAFL